MKLLFTGILLAISFTTFASEADTPCPAMNQETRVKIVDVKANTTKQVRSAVKQ